MISISKYNYNKDYFESIDSAEKAYWLGFLYADGCICRFYKNERLKSMYLSITLCSADRHHLEKFNDALNSNVPIKDHVSKLNGKEYKSSRLVISCTKMCYDLIKHGCTPQKTYTIQFPTYDIVPKEYMKDWIEGFFDGDGCISTRTDPQKPHIEVTITGMEQMLNDICSFLIEYEIITRPPKLYHTKSKACSIYIYGNDAKRFLDYIYKNSKVYLDRKYNKYIDFYKNYTLLDIHGVHWSNRNRAYIVTIYMDGKNVRVGQAKNLEEAVQMRKEAEIAKFKNSPLGQ